MFLMFVLAPVLLLTESKVPGTRVSLTPPSGFAPAIEFAGFVAGDTEIRVQEYVRGIGALEELHTDARLLSRGIAVRNRSRVKVAGRSGHLLEVEEDETEEVRMFGWILLFGNEDASVRIWGRVPATEWTGSPVKNAILTAEWDPEQNADPFRNVGVKITLPSFEIARIATTSLLLTEDGEEPDGRFEDAQVLITRREDTARAKTVAHQKVKDWKQLQEKSVTEEAPVILAGLTGYQVAADAKGPSGQSVVLRVVVLRNGQDVIILEGVHKHGDPVGDRIEQAFRTVTHNQ